MQKAKSKINNSSEGTETKNKTREKMETGIENRMEIGTATGTGIEATMETETATEIETRTEIGIVTRTETVKETGTNTETEPDINQMNDSGLKESEMSLKIDNVVSTDEYFKTSESVFEKPKKCKTAYTV